MCDGYFPFDELSIAFDNLNPIKTDEKMISRHIIIQNLATIRRKPYSHARYERQKLSVFHRQSIHNLINKQNDPLHLLPINQCPCCIRIV